MCKECVVCVLILSFAFLTGKEDEVTSAILDKEISKVTQMDKAAN